MKTIKVKDATLEGIKLLASELDMNGASHGDVVHEAVRRVLVTRHNFAVGNLDWLTAALREMERPEEKADKVRKRRARS